MLIWSIAMPLLTSIQARESRPGAITPPASARWRRMLSTIERVDTAYRFQNALNVTMDPSLDLPTQATCTTCTFSEGTFCLLGNGLFGLWELIRARFLELLDCCVVFQGPKRHLQTCKDVRESILGTSKRRNHRLLYSTI